MKESTQFRDVRDAVWACRLIGGSAKLVALRLVEHWPRIYPSLASLTENTGLSERTVRTALRELEDKGVIRTNHARGRSSSYSFLSGGLPITIGRLGTAVPRQDLPDPRNRQNLPEPPRQDLPDTPAESAVAPRQNLPPKQTKQTPLAGGRSESPPPAGEFCRTWEGWTLSDSLRAEIVAAGVPPEDVDRRLNSLKKRPIGGRSGWLGTLDDYVREFVPRWVLWAKQDGRVPDCGAALGVPIRFPSGVVPPSATWAPEPRALAFCSKHRLDLPAEVAEFKRRGLHGRADTIQGIDQAFRSWLSRRARAASKARGEAAPVAAEERAVA